MARPEALAQDETPMAPVLVHLFEELKRKNALPKIAILLQATSPLRHDEDIRNALTLFKESQFELVMSVIKADPGVLKYGYLKRDRFTPISSPEHCFANRQALPNVVRPNGAVYVFSPEVVLERGSLATESIGSIEMPEIRSIDIDTQADLQAAEDYIAQQSYSKAS